MEGARGRAYLERPGPCWGYFKALIDEDDDGAEERRRAEEKQQHSEEKRRKAEEDNGLGEEEEGFGENDDGFGEEDKRSGLTDMMIIYRDSKSYMLSCYDSMRYHSFFIHSMICMH